MRPSTDAEFVAMVGIGAGGIFNGLTYFDEEGELKTAEDYILNRLSYAKAQQYITIFWHNFWNHKGYQVLDPRASSAGGLNSVI